MRVFLKFEDFGKIKSGRIELSDFTVFVGENNSGKTFVMQLIYAVQKEICKMNVFSGKLSIGNSEEEKLGKEFIYSLIEEINIYLDNNKSTIIENYFHRSIPIKVLKLEIEDVEEHLILKHKEQEYVFDFGDEKKERRVRSLLVVTILLSGKRGNIQGRTRYVTPMEDRENFVKGVCTRIISIILNSEYSYDNLLFLPASRTGMLLLYKYFFSEKDKKESDLLFEFDFELGEKSQKENELGLTVPVYDFLQFLLRYTLSENNSKDNEELIKFIEKNLINGKFIDNGGEMLYKRNKELTPLYLASSMINEIAPIFKVLTGRVDYRTLLYDEIETCLHPEKQKQMARLLVRMCNAGYKLVVSTHSDTMAGKLNNLLMLSYMNQHSERCGLKGEDIDKKLEKLNLEKEDLLESAGFHVYQFTSDAEDKYKSTIKEIEFDIHSKVGFDFQQFSKSAMDLYEETMVIIGE